MVELKRTAVLVTCHNRCETTFKSLSLLYHQNILFDVYLVDDGSSDGTSEMIMKHFPKVVLIQGDGSLFWNRGMHLAWSKAIEHDYDYYFWLNDDTKLKPNGLEHMIELCEGKGDLAIICGAIQDERTLEFTYGGKDKYYNPIIPNGQDQLIYYMNGNVVLIPRIVCKKIGLLDPIFNHDLGDYDYGLRARKSSFGIFTTYDYVGFCERNVSVLSKGRKMGTSLKKRFARLYSPFGYHPIQQFRYTLRHFGFVRAFWIFIKLHIINLVSDNFYRKFINSKAEMISPPSTN